MTITAAIVLFAVIWFMLFLMILPLRLQTQGEAGTTVKGTHASAPENPQIGRKAKVTTLIAAVLWCVSAGIITSGVISIRDIDIMGTMGPEEPPLR